MIALFQLTQDGEQIDDPMNVWPFVWLFVSIFAAAIVQNLYQKAKAHPFYSAWRSGGAGRTPTSRKYAKSELIVINDQRGRRPRTVWWCGLNDTICPMNGVLPRSYTKDGVPTQIAHWMRLPSEFETPANQQMMQSPRRRISCSGLGDALSAALDEACTCRSQARRFWKR